MISLSRWIIVVFGVFFLCVGLLMLFSPLKARNILRKAGSTNLINYGEITIRMIPAVALIVYADYSKYPTIFAVTGWFMLITSIILYFVPRQIHHAFSMKSADFLKPVYFQLISPFSMMMGLVIIWCVY